MRFGFGSMFHSFILQAHLVGLKLHVDLAQLEGVRGVDGRVARRGDAPQHAVDVLGCNSIGLS